MLSPLHELKQNHFFKQIDFDNNGYLEHRDFVSIGDNLAALRGIRRGTDDYELIQSAMEKFWDAIRLDSDENKNYRITNEEWLNFIDEKIIEGKKEWYDEFINNFVRLLFNVLDHNTDGEISLEEYVHLIVAFGVEPKVAVETFDKIDANRDGIINLEEMIIAVEEFFKSNDMYSPGNWLFGPYWKKT